LTLPSGVYLYTRSAPVGPRPCSSLNVRTGR
jgi:hypothetical protein